MAHSNWFLRNIISLLQDSFLLGAKLVCQPLFSSSSPCSAVLLEGMLQYACNFIEAVKFTFWPPLISITSHLSS